MWETTESHSEKGPLPHGPSQHQSLLLGWLQIFLFVSLDFTTIFWMCFHAIPVVCLLIISISMLWTLLFIPYSYPLPLLQAFVSSVFYFMDYPEEILLQAKILSHAWVLLSLFLLHHSFSANPIGYAMSLCFAYSLQKLFTESWHSFRHCVIYRSV